MALSTERRKRLRVKVAWTVLLRRDGADSSAESTTVDVSSTGFYCISDEAFNPGEILWCQLLVPSRNPLSREECLFLECRVRVLRVNDLDNSMQYGTACRIEDYCVIARPLQMRTPENDQEPKQHGPFSELIAAVNSQAR